MITGDFLAMSLTTDRVRPSKMPNSWQSTESQVQSDARTLLPCVLHGSPGSGQISVASWHRALQTLTWSVLCLAARPRLYHSRTPASLGLRPSIWLVLSSVADVLIISTLATFGIAMAPLPIAIIATELGARLPSVRSWTLSRFQSLFASVFPEHPKCIKHLPDWQKGKRQFSSDRDSGAANVLFRNRFDLRSVSAERSAVSVAIIR